MYTVMDERRLEDMRGNHIIEAGTSAWYSGVGNFVGLRLEASGGGGICNPLFFRQRAPMTSRNQHQITLVLCSTYHSWRYCSLSSVQPEVRCFKVLKI